MSQRSIKWVLFAIWQRYWKAIVTLVLLGLASAVTAIYYHRDYWKMVVGDTWQMVENLSGGTKISLAGGAAFPIVFWFFKWLFSRRVDLKATFLDEVFKPALATLVTYALLGVFYMVLIAQPKIYETRPGSIIAYVTKSNRVEELTAELKTAKTATEKFKTASINSSGATNFPMALAVLDSTRAVLRQHILNFDTNTADLDAILQNQFDKKALAKLEQTEKALKEFPKVQPFLNVLRYSAQQAYSAFGNGGDAPELPPLDWFAELYVTQDHATKPLPEWKGTDFTAGGEYIAGHNPGIEFRLKKNTGIGSSVRFQLDKQVVRASLRRGGQPLKTEDLSLTNETVWTTGVDNYLGLLIKAENIPAK